MTNTAELVQRSDEWRMARAGHVTASRVGDIVKTLKRASSGRKAGEPAANRGKYLSQIVAERITGRPQDWKEIKSLDDRAAMEPEARAWYSLIYGDDIQTVGFVKHPNIQWAGASPDGLIKKTGGLEFKCLDAANHLKLFSQSTRDSIIAEHLPQVLFGMACTGRKWWDFVAYHPHMPEEMRMFRQRIKRDEEAIGLLEQAVRGFLEEVEQKIAALRNSNKIRTSS